MDREGDRPQHRQTNERTQIKWQFSNSKKAVWPARGRHHLQPQTILRLKTFLEAFQVFTEFDLLIAAVSSPDCQPILFVDYEEIEKLSEEISQQSSVLLKYILSKIPSDAGVLK